MKTIETGKAIRELRQKDKPVSAWGVELRAEDWIKKDQVLLICRGTGDYVLVKDLKLPKE